MNGLEIVISSIFNLLLGVVYSVVAIVLVPIDAIVDTFLPQIDDYATALEGFLDSITSYLGWAIDASGIPYPIMILVAVFLVFKLSAPLQVYVIKNGLQWYRALKG